MSFNAFSMSSEEYPGIFNRLICQSAVLVIFSLYSFLISLHHLILLGKILTSLLNQKQKYTLKLLRSSRSLGKYWVHPHIQFQSSLIVRSRPRSLPYHTNTECMQLFRCMPYTSISSHSHSSNRRV